MTPFKPRCLLLTGGAGFIGSNFARWALAHDPQLVLINLDLLTYAGNLESLADVQQRDNARYHFVHGDIGNQELVKAILGGKLPNGHSIPVVDAVVHMAAESHVDRSIMGPAIFIETNVRGTLSMLEACRASLKDEPRDFRFLHVSTDEVYGTLKLSDPAFTENNPIAPNSPYSASKAGSDLLVRAYVETFGFPGIITRCSNNYGPYQFPEKLVPLLITRALRDQPLPVYGDGLQIRDWLHVEDHASALWSVLTKAKKGDVYNIGGEAETANIDIVKSVLSLLGKPESLIRYVTDRPGHDRRYAMDITLIKRDLGWTPRNSLASGLQDTVAWYLANRTWWERVLSEAYRAASAMYLAEV
jgi:dTDP-glucose 4,6-dehydratase